MTFNMEEELHLDCNWEYFEEAQPPMCVVDHDRDYHPRTPFVSYTRHWNMTGYTGCELCNDSWVQLLLALQVSDGSIRYVIVSDPVDIVSPYNSRPPSMFGYLWCRSLLLKIRISSDLDYDVCKYHIAEFPPTLQAILALYFKHFRVLLIP